MGSLLKKLGSYNSVIVAEIKSKIPTNKPHSQGKKVNHAETKSKEAKG